MQSSSFKHDWNCFPITSLDILTSLNLQLLHFRVFDVIFCWYHGRLYFICKWLFWLYFFDFISMKNSSLQKNPLFFQLSDLIDYDASVWCITWINHQKYIDKSQKSITSDDGRKKSTHIKLHGIFHLIKCINLSRVSCILNPHWFA